MEQLKQYILEKFKITQKTAFNSLNKLKEDMSYYIVPWGAGTFIPSKFLIGKRMNLSFETYDYIYLIPADELYKAVIKDSGSISRFDAGSFCYTLKDEYYKPEIFDRIGKEDFSQYEISDMVDDYVYIKAEMKKYEKSNNL